MAATAVVAGTAGAVRHRQEQRWANQEQQAYEQDVMAQQAMAASAQPAEPDYTAELEQLARLKQEGILTDEEFEAKKRQILGI
jgi:hypothetical protein